RVKHDNSPRPQLLSLIHGSVGVAHQLLRALIIPSAESDSDADADPPLSPVERKRWIERAPDALSDDADVGRINLLQQRGELIAAKPRERVSGAYFTGNPARHIDEQTVAHGVPPSIIYQFEAVQIQEQNRVSICRVPLTENQTVR